MSGSINNGYQINRDRRNLAIGGGIYGVATAVWLLIAYLLGVVAPLWAGVLALPILVLLVAAVMSARRLPSQASQAQQTAVGKWIGIIFAWEGIFIGVGSGVLAALGLADWILVWVTVIVGLHFFPLGYLLGLRFDYGLGAAIVLLVSGALALDLSTRQTVLSLGTMGLLWLAGVVRLMAARGEG